MENQENLALGTWKCGIGISGDALRIIAPRHKTGLGRVGGGLTRRVALSRPALTIGENGDQSRDSES